MSQKEEFVGNVEALADLVKRWAEAHGWVTQRYPKKMRDSDHQIYEATALFLQKGAIRLLLDPVAYDVPGAQAVVDLALMPTYDDAAALYLEQGAWNIHYAFPPDSNGSPSVAEAQSLILSEETINQVLDSIAAHAEPSF